MKANLYFVENQDYLFVKVVGEWIKEEIETHIRSIQEEANRYRFNKILVEALNVELDTTTEMIRFYTGEHIAKIWGWNLKAAFIGRAKFINHFAETVAINRGANIAVFSDKSKAFKWLIN